MLLWHSLPFTPVIKKIGAGVVLSIGLAKRWVNNWFWIDCIYLDDWKFTLHDLEFPDASLNLIDHITRIGPCLQLFLIFKHKISLLYLIGYMNQNNFWYLNNLQAIINYMYQINKVRWTGCTRYSMYRILRCTICMHYIC